MKHFSRSEFKCKCGCGFSTVDFELAEVLDDVRERFQRPIIVTSGCRCPEYNKKVNGSDNSQHQYGKAADIMVLNVRPDVVVKYLESKYPNKFGIGLYKTWVHVDTRSSKARWNK